MTLDKRFRAQLQEVKNIMAQVTQSKSTKAAQPAKATQPKADANGTAKSDTKPDFDASAFTIAPASKPMPKRTRTGKPNPFIAAVKRSWDDKTDMSVTVPREHTKRVSNLIRAAATHLDLGTNLVIEQQSDGSDTLYFRAKERTERKAKDDKATPATPEAPSASK